MDDPTFDLLEPLQRHAEALVAQRLRSVSAVIARLHEAIAQAHAMGHSHAAIHSRLRAAGLPVSWNNYRAALVRARGRMPRVAADAPPAPPHASMLAGSAEGAGAIASASAPMQLLDALASAQRAAARDYAQVARASSRRTGTSS